jgi:hypothetical protein
MISRAFYPSRPLAWSVRPDASQHTPDDLLSSSSEENTTCLALTDHGFQTFANCQTVNRFDERIHLKRGLDLFERVFGRRKGLWTDRLLM